MHWDVKEALQKFGESRGVWMDQKMYIKNLEAANWNDQN